MSKGPAPVPTVESLVALYRSNAEKLGIGSAAGRRGTNVELEVRARLGSAAEFRELFSRVRAATAAAPDLTLMVSSISGGSGSLNRAAQAPRGSRNEARIREIYFSPADGKRLRERNVKKTSLGTVRDDGWLLAVSVEDPIEDFTSDQGALLRVKARASFVSSAVMGDPAAEGDPAAVGDPAWRVDLTVTRRVEIADLKATIAEMFGGGVTPEAFLDRFAPVGAAGAAGAAGTDKASADDSIQFEAEVEFVPRTAAEADEVRPEAVRRVAALVARPKAANQTAPELSNVARLLGVPPPTAARYASGEYGLKQLLPQVVALTRAEYRDVFPPLGHYLTDKADGQRGLAIVRAGIPAGRIVTSTETYAFEGSGEASVTVLDGEVIVREGRPHFYAFDAIAVEGRTVAALPFEKRLELLAAGVAALARAGVPASAKRFVHLMGEGAVLEAAVRSVFDAEYGYECDGLILVQPGKNYADTVSYKWKPVEHNTIDFYARRAPEAAVAAAGAAGRQGTPYVLLVGISPDLLQRLGLRPCEGYAELWDASTRHRLGVSYAPIQFSPSDMPWAYLYWAPPGAADLDGKIVEMRARGIGPRFVDWEAVRVRDDRAGDLARGVYFGNDVRTAELTWIGYLDPFPLAQLWEGVGGDYFQTGKSAAYRAQTAVTSFVKTRRIEALGGLGWVVDLAAGKGQDLGRYLEAGVQHLVAVDVDRAALAELVRRKYDHARRSAGRGHGHGRGHRTAVHVLPADLNRPWEESRDQIRAFGLPPAGADAVVCNLAAHYFLDSVACMRNFAQLVAALVRGGGAVSLTVMDGQRIHALFEREKTAPGAAWNAHEGGALRYSLRRDYASGELAAAGQKIGVLLPFSGGEYYVENVVNIEALTAAFAELGLTRLPAADSVADALPAFRSTNPDLAAALTASDSLWLSLYRELVFRADQPAAEQPTAEPTGGAAVDEVKDDASGAKDHTRAWVALVMRGDKYVPGAVVTAHSLRDAGTRYDLVCMVTPDVGEEARRRLAAAYDRVVEVPYITQPTKPLPTENQRKIYSSWIDDSFTKWNCLSLPYRRVIFTDVDILYRANCDDLFDVPAPAGCFSSPWGAPYEKNGFPNGYEHYRHGETVPSELIRRNMYERSSFVCTGAQVVLDPAPGDLERYTALVRAAPVYGAGIRASSGADETSIVLFYLQKGATWRQLDHSTQWTPWKPHWKTPLPIRAYHFIGEKPWLSANNWPDYAEWWACARRHGVETPDAPVEAPAAVPAKQ